MSRWFNHPYKPYDIQLQLMEQIYDCIDNDYKIGIFESPTGTGKTLSLICSTMTWLRKRKIEDEDDSDDEPDWVKNEYKKLITNKSKNSLKEYEEYLSKIEKDHVRKEQKLETKKVKKQVDEDDFLPEDYDENSKITKEIEQLLKKNEEEVSFEAKPVKIFYSSRTHSQLNQFSSQLKLTKFDSSFDDVSERIKYISLGSRKQLCVNDKIRHKNDLVLNDSCIDLQKNQGCEYHQKSTPIKDFTDFSIAKIRDIEELNELGQELKICPYYSNRKTVELVEIVSLPYQMLVQDSTRKIMNLDLKNSIIIIDEAHNIIDTINSIYSVGITTESLNNIIKSLKIYFGKFSKRLNSGNRINLQKLIKLCTILINFINNSKVVSGEEFNPNEIFKSSTGDLINIHKLDTFLTTTKIAYKIESYMESQHSSNPLLFNIVKFLKCLNNPSNEGKFFWDTNNGVSLNYMLLNPSHIFKQLIDEARCVLLCGGTMEPMNDFVNNLFPEVPSHKIKQFSCNHIIPDDNLKVFPIAKYNNFEFEFSYEKRNNVQQLDRLGEFLVKLSKVVPHGMVIFFPSYNYLNLVMNHLKKFQFNKNVFQESKDCNIDSTLSDYSSTIAKGEGAILFSIVGGKLSEGINFSDDLARCVIMIGLPYPNLYSGELITKMKYIETESIRRGATTKESKENSRQYYENLCMKAINQSIGRSIRHINDYSTIYLIDKRYSQLKIQNKLSKWIKNRITNSNNVFDETNEFFINKSVKKLR
ncbi:unnamed protein product [Candida verbasci]|uniref:ATP-dependent DNA helicase CHL1 n=1 Tax=Candida verbasci TaxID=1227364 RepID=A0A9W4TRI7_9ASCO|nr:unnamed protein product [Candida verbasci]